MGTISTIVNPEPRIFGFSGLADAQLENSEVPRAEVVYAEDFTIEAGTVTDDQAVFITCILPQNFAWVVVDLHFSVITSDKPNGQTVGWDSPANFVFADGPSPTMRTIQIPGIGRVEGISMGTESNSSIIPYWFENIPKMVLVPKPGQAAQLSVRVANREQDRPECSGSFAARFMMYDIAQAHHFYVNTPALVR